VRRHEAPTQQDWRALHDSYDCEREFVLTDGPLLTAWAGISDREAYVLDDGTTGDTVQALLDLVEGHSGRHAALVLRRYQESIERHAIERGYQPLGTRIVCARRLAAFNPLKEVVPVAAETVPLPH
jgi:hypothetical protein